MQREEHTTIQGGHLQAQRPQEKPNLPTTPWAWTSRLQNCEKINFCQLGHPACGTGHGSPSQQAEYLNTGCRGHTAKLPFQKTCYAKLQIYKSRLNSTLTSIITNSQPILFHFYFHPHSPDWFIFETLREPDHICLYKPQLSRFG